VTLGGGAPWALGLALALALIPAPAPAKDAPLRYTAGDVFQGMLDAQDKLNWMQADIVKTEQVIGSTKAPTVTRGRLVSKHGGRARLVISDPAPGLILADGKRLWVELPQVSQVMCYDEAKLAASGNFFLDLASSIRHYAKASIKRRFQPGDDYDSARVSALEMVPTHPRQAGFESLRVWVDDKRWVVLRVEMEYGGTRSDVTFKNIQILSNRAVRADPGQALAPTLFEYTPPKGYEVFNLDL
jgi:outer membrane lipoprotein-sorting protein